MSSDHSGGREDISANELNKALQELVEEANNWDEETELGTVYANVANGNFLLNQHANLVFGIGSGGGSGTSGGSLTSLSGKLGTTLKKWIKTLRSKLKKIAQKVNAQSFSVTVGSGTPISVSVSVTFSVGGSGSGSSGGSASGP